MDNKYETADDILNTLQEMAKSHEIMDAETYLRGAERLNALLQAEQESLYLMEQEVAKLRSTALVGATAAHAKITIEASDSYRMARNQKAKVERCLETIRLSKLHARLAQEILYSSK